MKKISIFVLSLFLTGCAATTFRESMLHRFYERRCFEPAWSDSLGPRPQVDALVKTIREASKEGLRPNDYYLSEIEAKIQRLRTNQKKKKSFSTKTLSDLDLLLTDAFLVYGSHLLTGGINPATIQGEWSTGAEDIDIVGVLDAALDSNRVEEALRSLLPQHPGYARLRDTLAEYRKIAEMGGWPTIPDAPIMQKGDRGGRVLALKSRLVATGDLELVCNGDLFDDALELAVRKFQKRHGWDVTGVVDPLTLSDLNMPVQARIRQIELNLERWRWLPRDFGQRYIFLDIAGFELEVVENGQRIMKMPIIVGQPSWYTPAFSGRITHLVLNPSWCIPPSIAIKEVLPKIQADPDYLAEQNFKVTKGCGIGSEEIDPETINWSGVNEKNLNFWLVQMCGPTNPLGRVKFMFPNEFLVYVHDTPQRELFSLPFRALSHGCVRIKKPFELAEYLLQTTRTYNPRSGEVEDSTQQLEESTEPLNLCLIDPTTLVAECLARRSLDWTRLNIEAAIQSGIEQILVLPEPINIHLVYLTTWVNEDGSVEFRTDVYGHDRFLDKALRQKPSDPWQPIQCTKAIDNIFIDK